MNITSIQIKNIKGIENKSFKLDLPPNKPNILVAPNGFGKSSFAIGFDSLKSSKIELDDKHYYLNQPSNRPEIILTLTTGQTLRANDTQNTIADFFDVFVINNQTEPKSVVQTFDRRTISKTTLDILPTTLIKTIPEKISFEYNSTTLKATFGANGNKLLKNISNLFNCGELFVRIENDIDFSRFDLNILDHFKSCIFCN